MSEIRLTFGTKDFGAVSQMLVDMGVSFRVEPMKAAEAEAIHAKTPPSPASPPRVQAKKSRKPAPAARPSAKGDERHVSGADRLREAIIRNQASGGPASPETPDRSTDE